MISQPKLVEILRKRLSADEVTEIERLVDETHREDEAHFELLPESCAIEECISLYDFLEILVRLIVVPWYTAPTEKSVG